MFWKRDNRELWDRPLTLLLSLAYLIAPITYDVVVECVTKIGVAFLLHRCYQAKGRDDRSVLLYRSSRVHFTITHITLEMA